MNCAVPFKTCVPSWDEVVPVNLAVKLSKDKVMPVGPTAVAVIVPEAKPPTPRDSPYESTKMTLALPLGKVVVVLPIGCPTTKGDCPPFRLIKFNDRLLPFASCHERPTTAM